MPSAPTASNRHAMWRVVTGSLASSAVLARIGEVGDDGDDTVGGRVLERADEEQEPDELVVRALARLAVEGVDDEDVAPAR